MPGTATDDAPMSVVTPPPYSSVTLSLSGTVPAGSPAPGTATLPSIVTGEPSGAQIVTKALPARAHTPGCVLIAHIAAAIAQSTALPPSSAVSLAASAAVGDVVATATF